MGKTTNLLINTDINNFPSSLVFDNLKTNEDQHWKAFKYKNGIELIQKYHPKMSIIRILGYFRCRAERFNQTLLIN